MIEGMTVRTRQRSSSGGYTLPFVIFLILISRIAYADLRTGPLWWDENGVGSSPDWHYRVPVNIPASTSINSTIRFDVNFNDLLSQMGVSGTFDPGSVRIVRSSSIPAAYHEFTDGIYNGIDDAVGDGKGEIRFILEDTGPVTYFLYFDITQNGSKTAWPQPINGNFESSSTGQEDPSGWSATKTRASFDAQVRPSETVTVDTNGTTYGNGSHPRPTDGTPYSGRYSYLLGARTSNESGNGTPVVTLTRSIAVPAVNPGNITIRYRVEGWDSSENGSTSYDYIRIRLNSQELVGPSAGNYVQFPFSANYGNHTANSTRSGYGQYNGWDTDTNGTHHMGMTLARGSEPWFTVTYSLAAFSGQTINLEITSSHVTLYRNWFHIDDVEWSVVGATLDIPQAFGANVIDPNDTDAGPSSTYMAGSTLSIASIVDADVTAVTAYVFDENSTPVTPSGITLFNDGTAGDATAGDDTWTNDGTNPAYPTYTIPPGAVTGSQWMVRVYAKDGSSSTVGAANGLVHIPGAAGTSETQSNYFNIDEQNFIVIPPLADLSTSTKDVVDVDGGDTKPGDTLSYTITLMETGGASASGVSVTDDMPSFITGFSVKSLPPGAVDNSTGTGTGANNTGYLNITNIGVSALGTASIVFEVTIDPSAPLGTVIGNTAVINNPAGPGASPQAPDVIVFDSTLPASGNKQLYFQAPGPGSPNNPGIPQDMSRTPLTSLPSPSNIRIRRQDTPRQWLMTPSFQAPMTLNNDSSVVLLLARNNSTNTRTIRVTLDTVGSTTITLGSADLSVPGTSLSRTIPTPITFPITTPQVSLPAGTAIRVTVDNDPAGGTGRTLFLYPFYNGDTSRVVVNAATVINVDDVSFYDAPYPGGTRISHSAPGAAVYVRAVVSDPFGSFDITGATLDLIDPSSTVRVVSASMAHQLPDPGPSTKTYEYQYTLPVFGSDGIWTARVTADEGTENTIIHQGVGVLDVGAPLLTILKSAGVSTVNPGEIVTYSVQVANTGTGNAINVVLDDNLSPYTAIRILYDDTQPIPFVLEPGTSGLAMGTPLYSMDNGSTYVTGPLVSGGGGAPLGFDGNVTHWKIPMTGSMGYGGANFNIKYQIVVK